MLKASLFLSNESLENVMPSDVVTVLLRLQPQKHSDGERRIWGHNYSSQHDTEKNQKWCQQSATEEPKRIAAAPRASPFTSGDVYAA